MNDLRTQYEKDLEAVENAMRAVIDGKGVKSYRIHTNIGERELERMSLSELQEHHRWIKRMVNQERQKLGKKPLGGDQWGQVRFCVGGYRNQRRHYKRKRGSR